MIIAENLTKHYGNTLVLKNISFQIRDGESIAVWGENGAGKTTLFRCILGITPFEGSLTVAGHKVLDEGKITRSKIGYVPQEMAFYQLSVAETMMFYAKLKKLPETAIEPAIHDLHLEPHWDKPVQTLSGGMKQRLALGLALLGDPQVLLLDEPTSNLDAKSQQDFVTRVRDLNRDGKTIIFASHRIQEVENLATRVLFIDKDELVHDCAASEAAAYLGFNEWLTLQFNHQHRATLLELIDKKNYTAKVNEHIAHINIGAQSKVDILNDLQASKIEISDFHLSTNRDAQIGKED